MTAIDPTPFLRGVAFPASRGIPYPRLRVDDVGIPQDVMLWSWMPIGVRLELIGDADALEVEFHLDGEDLGSWGDAAGTTFEIHRRGAVLDSIRVSPGERRVQLRLSPSEARAAPDDVAVVYLPVGYRPTVLTVCPINGSIAPAPSHPRWIAYGDSITAGMGSSAPAHAWPALAARSNLLDVVNLGFPACGRGELAVAGQIAELERAVVSVAFGTNCWSTLACPPQLLRETLRAFVDLVSVGDVPVVVVTPTLRPEAESTPNRFGATLTDLRRAMEDVANEMRDEGRPVDLVAGTSLLTENQLADGVHPNDVGHAALAGSIGPVVSRALRRDS
jgi:lysophospholipase L1-like esterase